ncbi:GrlR family regulatory protein [Pantoea ananatis]|uniref:GrlR family regulatory protein n=1 Tax=Pantoea ananas TaxID=553 RepID=UPI00301A7EAE
MKDGIYYVSFRSNQQDFGNGIVTINKGKVNGGDYAYIYQGEIDDNSSVLKITRFNEQATSVFGPLKEFYLDLKVNSSTGEPILEGNVQGRPEFKIQIYSKLLAPLA